MEHGSFLVERGYANTGFKCVVNLQHRTFVDSSLIRTDEAVLKKKLPRFLKTIQFYIVRDYNSICIPVDFSQRSSN